MNTKQDQIRLRLNEYIETHGVKAKWICEQVELDPSLICRFRKGQRELWQESLDKIEEFLNTAYK